MKKNIFVLTLFILILNSCDQTNVSELTLNVSELSLEYMDNPIGIDSKQPLLSWQIQSNGRSVLQSAYEIRVSKNAETLSKNRQLVWQTGKVSSSASLHHVYEGESLESGQKYYWQVRVWDTNANASEWSDVAYWKWVWSTRRIGKQNGSVWMLTTLNQPMTIESCLHVWFAESSILRKK